MIYESRCSFCETSRGFYLRSLKRDLNQNRNYSKEKIETLKISRW